MAMIPGTECLLFDEVAATLYLSRSQLKKSESLFTFGVKLEDKSIYMYI